MEIKFICYIFVLYIKQIKKMTIILNNEIYKTSNEEIKIGDWFYCTDRTNYAHIFKCIDVSEEDLSVFNGDKFGEFFDKFNNPSLDDDIYGDWAKCSSYKITHSTNGLDGTIKIDFNELIEINANIYNY